MKNFHQTPTLYLSHHECAFSFAPEQVVRWEETQGLVPPPHIMQALPEPLDFKQMALLLDEDLLLPQKIPSDAKVTGKELAPWLLWKTKKFLPYPADQACQRFTPMGDGWLTFTLPKPWVEAVCSAFHKRGIQLGMVGSVFDQITQMPHLWGHALILIYHDFWIFSCSDPKGNLEHFRMRRLPLGPNGDLDQSTLVDIDGSQCSRERAAERPALFCNLSTTWNEKSGALQQSFQRWFPELVGANLFGTRAERMQQLQLGAWS